jgi:hypothetical protein
MQGKLRQDIQAIPQRRRRSFVEPCIDSRIPAILAENRQVLVHRSRELIRAIPL